MLFLILLLIPNLAFASPKSCVANDGSTFPYEEFGNRGAAELFAGEVLKQNIIKEEGNNIWRVYLKLPDQSCAYITED